MSFPGTIMPELPNSTAPLDLLTSYIDVYPTIEGRSVKTLLAKIKGLIPELITVNRVLTIDDFGKSFSVDCSAGDISITFPPMTVVHLPFSIEKIDISKNGWKPIPFAGDFIEDPDGHSNLDRHFRVQYEHFTFQGVGLHHCKISHYYSRILPTLHEKLGTTTYTLTADQSLSLVSTPDDFTVDIAAGRGEFMVEVKKGESSWRPRKWDAFTGIEPLEGVNAIGVRLEITGTVETITPVFTSRPSSVFTPPEYTDNTIQTGSIGTQDIGGGTFFITGALSGTILNQPMNYIINLENDIGVFNSVDLPMLLDFPGGLNVGTPPGNSHSFIGGFPVDWMNPSVIRRSADIPILPILALIFQSGLFVISGTAEADPNNYENLSSPNTTTALTGNQVTAQQAILFPQSSITGFFYAYVVFSNMAAAIAGWRDQQPFIGKGVETALKTQTALFTNGTTDIPTGITGGSVLVITNDRMP